MECRPMKILPMPAAMLALSVLCGPAQAQDPVRHGHALAKQFCAECHAIGKTGKSAHVGAPPFRTFGNRFDLDHFPRLLIRGISSNHPDMPVFKFSPQDAVDLRDYLRTIQE
jgi:cytochrome c